MIILGISLILFIWIKDNSHIQILQKVLKIITIVIITMLILNIINPKGVIVKEVNKNEKNTFRMTLLTNAFIHMIFKILIYIICGFIILKELGYDLNGLVAGFGIGSAIVALALQDLVKSLISGATILSEKPFKIGDTIQIGEHIGTVKNITLRNTVLKLLDNNEMSVPNSKIISECVKNLNRVENRKIELKIFVDFYTEEEKLKRIVSKLTTMLKEDEEVLEDTVRVNISDILQDGVGIRIFVNVVEMKLEEYFKSKEKINYGILNVLKSENVKPLYRVTQVVKEENENVETKYIEE